MTKNGTEKAHKISAFESSAAWVQTFGTGRVPLCSTRIPKPPDQPDDREDCEGMDLATPVSTEELAGERRALAMMHREFDAAPGRSGLARYFPGPCPLHGCHAYRPMMPGPCHQQDT